VHTVLCLPASWWWGSSAVWRSLPHRLRTGRTVASIQVVVLMMPTFYISGSVPVTCTMSSVSVFSHSPSWDDMLGRCWRSRFLASALGSPCSGRHPLAPDALEARTGSEAHAGDPLQRW